MMTNLCLNRNSMKTRTKTFEELKQLTLDGIEKHWSRSFNNVGFPFLVQVKSIQFNT